MTLDYDSACAEAATRQGLDPLTEALTKAGVTHGVEQTGGFTMVVTVKTHTGVWAVIADGTEPNPFLMAFYPGDTWADGGEEQMATPDLTVGQVVAHARLVGAS